MREVVTDIVEHTVTVTFDDAEGTLEEVLEALNSAGYTAGKPVPLR